MTDPTLVANIVAHSWNKDGSLVAICPNTHEVHIYEAKGENIKKWGSPRYILSQHFMTVMDVDWSHATNQICTTGQDRNGYVWTLNDKDEWAPTLVILRIGHAGTCIKWSPDGQKFAVGCGSKQIPVCHYEESQDLWVAKTIKKGPKSTVLCLDWSPNCLFIVSGGCDFKIRIFSAFIKGVDDKSVNEPYNSLWGGKCFDFGKVLVEFDQCKGWIESCAFSPSGLRLAVASHDSAVHFIEIGSDKSNDGCSKQTITRRDLPLRSIIFITDTFAIGGGYDNVPVMYEMKNEQWETKGILDGGNSTKKTENTKKSAFGNAFNMFDQKSKLGKASGNASGILVSRHQNNINGLCKTSDKTFTSTGCDGRILFWDINKKY